MFLASPCCCFCPIHWNHVLNWEWTCSWCSADRRSPEDQQFYCLLGCVLYLILCDKLLLHPLLFVMHKILASGLCEIRFRNIIMIYCKLLPVNTYYLAYLWQTVRYCTILKSLNREREDRLQIKSAHKAILLTGLNNLCHWWLKLISHTVHINQREMNGMISDGPWHHELLTTEL